MSRIEEALKRAAVNTGGLPPTAPDPTADVFRDPWAVGDEVEPETVTAAPLEPLLPEPVPPPPMPPPATVAPREATQAKTPPPLAVHAAPVHTAPVPPPAPAPTPAQTAPAPTPVRTAPAPMPVHTAPAPMPVYTAPAPEPKRPEPEPEVPTAAAPSLALFQGFDPSIAEKIVATAEIRPAFVEQYRKLAGVLHHQQLGTNIKVVMVTSAVAGEGKSLTATNLALTFSESYRRNVLLIDGDLRRPTLHETFQVPNTSGLGDGLRSEKEEKLTLVQVSPRLTLLTAGRPDPDPMSGLTSERMRRVIDEAATRFEWIIIDTPPVGLLPDARLLAEMADTTLLVINAGRTPFPFIRRAIDSIGRERIFGVVLNRADLDAATGGYRYYQYYDSYSKDSDRALAR